MERDGIAGSPRRIRRVPAQERRTPMASRITVYTNVG
jgi:hypothetical protein